MVAVRSYESVFKSSVPQRPQMKTAAAMFGGRPVGPMTYNPKNNLIQWENDTERQHSTFKSKTILSPTSRPLTADIDFMNDPFGAMIASYPSSPSAHGHKWPNALELREPARDPGLDEFSTSLAGTLSHGMDRSARKYASSFTSQAKRMPSIKHATPEALGPGAYSSATSSVALRDPKRQSSTFKSQTTSALFDTTASQPPDAIQSIQSAILSRHWTSSGCAFSTRERFPRERKKWKD